MAPVEPRPGGARPRPGTDAFLRRFARFVLGLLFREVELVGAERLPATGPVIVIANHSNSLVDGGILLAFLPRIPRFLAASTVWDYKPVAPFMTASGSVRVFRQQDGRAHEGSLEDSFAEAAALLVDGGVLAIFPEGRTHDTPALLPSKTGTARIAQFTETRHGPLDLPIVPVGIDYEAKTLFRTRVCFTFGPPVRLGTAAGTGPAVGARSGTEPGAGPGEGPGTAPGTPPGDGPGVDPAKDPGADKPRDRPAPNLALRAATGHLQRALSAVAPDFVDTDEARAMTLAAEILALEPGSRPGRPPAYSRIVTLRHAVEAAFLRAETVAEAHQTRAALDAYARALAHSGLADHAVAAPPGPAALWRSALALLPGLPVALVALVFCLPQALLLRSVSRTKPRDRQMTWITFGGLVVYALSWLLWAVALGLAAGLAVGGGWGWAVAGAVLVLAPLSARLALPTIDRGWRILRALRVRRLLRRDADLGPGLLALRARAEAALDTLLPDRSG